MLERRDFGVGATGLGLGLVLILGLFYYLGGRPALYPLISMGEKMAGRAGISVTPTPDDQVPVDSVTGGTVGSGGYTGSRGPGQPSTAGGVKVAPAAGSGQVLRVRQNNLSMHKCPGYECQSIGTLAIGTKVTLLGDRDTSTGEEWCRVRAGTREGWVSRYYLE